MPRDPRSEVSLTADFDAQPASLADREEREGTFRIAILGDFSARSHRGANPAPLAKRRVWRIDRDDIDTVLAGMAPELHLTIDPSEPPVVVRFETLDDFHPDQLVKRLPLFQQLRALRDQADAPARGSSSAPSRPAPRTARTESAALGLSSGSLLDRIIDNDPNAADPAQGIRGLAPQDELTEFVDRVVRPHTVREASKEQRDLTAKVDDVIAATMRVLLHHPEFQALEALWRGVEFLVHRLDTSETLQVVVIDVSKTELSADLGAAPDVDRTALHRLLTEGSSGRRASMVAGAYTFGPDDVVVLSRLATLGRMAGAPWLVAADPRLAGTPSFAADPDPDEWTIPQPAEWEGLRRSRDASFLSLVLPRFLLREPYGKRTDPCSFPFEEMLPGAPDHESFLWGNGAILCALAVGESVAAEEPVPSQATVGGLPLYVATIDGEAVATPCAEALITHRAVVHMLDRGLTPLASPRDGDSILISRLQSVAQPPRPLSIPNSTPS